MTTRQTTGRSRRAARVLAALTLLAGAFTAASGVLASSSSAASLASTCGNTGTPGATHHVIWIFMENESYGSVVGNANAPYQTQLAKDCGVATNMYSESHGSLVNYIAATNGRDITTNHQFIDHNDCSPNTTFCYSSELNIFSQLQHNGGTWRNYAEDMPSACYKKNSGNYAVRHAPAAYYPNLASTCGKYDVPMGDLSSRTGAFYTALAKGTLPSFSFISPNLIDDAHNSSTSVGDTWLSKIVPLITSSPNYQNGDTTLFITNDEGGASSDHTIGEDCANKSLAPQQPSCHIPTIVVSPHTPAGTKVGTFFTHFSMLRTTEQLLGLPLLGKANSANSMVGGFHLAPAGATSDSVSSMCGNSPPAGRTISHVLLVMLENSSYHQIVGNSHAPYQTQLASDCGVATSMFGATHTSAANYLAATAGQFPAESPHGCGSVAACSTGSPNLFHQLSAAGLSWKSYEESMPSACGRKSVGDYKIGHNPALFYSIVSRAACRSRDLPVADLTAKSGALWKDLANRTLPSFAVVTPNESHDGEGEGTRAEQITRSDTWLQNFLTTVSSSASYQAGTTLVLVTYDEGAGADMTVGEDCTNRTQDLPVTDGVSANQESCHIPLFAVYPYTAAGTHDGTFFDLYSVTRTVESLFGLRALAHAGDAKTNTLVGHFGIRAQ